MNENIDPVVSMRVGSRDSKKGWKTLTLQIWTNWSSKKRLQ